MFAPGLTVACVLGIFHILIFTQPEQLGVIGCIFSPPEVFDVFLVQYQNFNNLWL